LAAASEPPQPMCASSEPPQEEALRHKPAPPLSLPDNGPLVPPDTMWETMAEQQRELHDEEVSRVCAKLRQAVALRDKYRQPVERDEWQLGVDRRLTDDGLVPCSEDGSPGYDPFTPPTPVNSKRFDFKMHGGVMLVWSADSEPPLGGRNPDDCAFEPPPSFSKYTADLALLMRICADPAVNSFAWRRLQRLESRFHLHVMEHEQRETTEQRKVPHRDFYNIRKVDTHIHLAAAMNQKHLLRFIKKKCRVAPHEVVTHSADGKPVTLQNVFEQMGTTPHDLNLDALGMHADTSTFCRFDKFNLKYNPLGASNLRNIFLKTDNHLKGRYFAEVTRELFDDLKESKYQNTEYRISIYGRERSEWDSLAEWIVDHALYSNNNRWVIQVPRLYGMYHAKGMLPNFKAFLENLFVPLFEVSVNPESHPKLHLMLQQTVAFDLVDDESKPEGPLPTHDSPAPLPENWFAANPHYSYYCYFVYANLYTLNQLRRTKGLSTFCFRPHAGEAGDLNHLHITFLTARGINHGINLRKTPSLTYLYYLCQIGLALSPLSNNALFLRLSKNPFQEFFARGLNVSLSTDDPLMFHHTKEPLMEEYCVARQVWRLSSCDLAEIARNSVLQSSFEPCVKAAWIGRNYRLGGTEGNDIQKTNLPNLRVHFRHTLLVEERHLLVTCRVVPCAISTLPPSVRSTPVMRVTTADITAAHDEFGAPPSPSEKSPGLRRRRDSRSKAADDASNRVTEAVLEQAVEATRRRAEEAQRRWAERQQAAQRAPPPFAAFGAALAAAVGTGVLIGAALTRLKPA